MAEFLIEVSLTETIMHSLYIKPGTGKTVLAHESMKGKALSLLMVGLKQHV
jgi:hypothetical protein